MIAFALLLASVAGWTVTPASTTQAEITATRTLEDDLALHYRAHAGNVRSIEVEMIGCGSEKGFDTPEDGAGRHALVLENLNKVLGELPDKCKLDDGTVDRLTARFDDAYAEVEQLAAVRRAARPATPADRNELVAGWALEDVVEGGERKLRMRHVVGEAELEYRVMPGPDRRMNLMVGGCGGGTSLDLPGDGADRLAKANEELGVLIDGSAGNCKIGKKAQAELRKGFAEGFAAIEAWGVQRPVDGESY